MTPMNTYVVWPLGDFDFNAKLVEGYNVQEACDAYWDQAEREHGGYPLCVLPVQMELAVETVGFELVGRD